MATRRAILVTGAAAAAVIGAGAAWWALTRAPRAAWEPWDRARQGFGDPRLDALAHAILAPSAHNMQPWLIRLEGDDALALHCELSRRLPEVDPFDRQTVISLGGFLELLAQAAAERGRRAEIEPFPEGAPRPRLDRRPVARVRLVEEPGVRRDPLFATVLARRTSRAPFDTARVPPEASLGRVAAAAGTGVAAAASAEPGRVRDLRRLTAEAWRTEFATPGPRREMIAVTRIGRAEIEAEPHGIALAGPTIEALHLAGLVGPEEMDTPGSTAFEQTVATYARACETATAHCWILTDANGRADQLAAGRAWVRMHQAATAGGLACHPLSQALQEFPEMAGHRRAVHALLGAQGRTLQMLARLGHAEAPAPSPRWPLESRLIPA
jgi:hypothetical protein